MSAERIYYTRDFKYPTVAVAGVRSIGIVPGAVKFTDPGTGGSPGPAGSVIGKKTLTINVYGVDLVVLLALVGATAANGVAGIVGTAGANEKLTFKNLYFNSVPQAMNIPADDQGGSVAGFGISGDCQWGASDTFPLMIVAAADGA